MSGLADYDPPPVLRTLAEARQCIYLGPVLTADEVKTYAAELLRGGIPCRHCNGEIPGYHCGHPVEGPFTKVAGKCTSCNGFSRLPVAESRSLATG